MGFPLLSSGVPSSTTFPPPPPIPSNFRHARSTPQTEKLDTAESLTLRPMQAHESMVDSRATGGGRREGGGGKAGQQGSSPM